MLPEVEEFFKYNEDSDDTYAEEAQINAANPVPRWDEKWNAEQRAEFYAAEEKRSLAVLRARQARREKRAAAYDSLRNSTDPVVRWLATDRILARDYPDYRNQVLRALPMNREEIDSFGDVRGWCSDYTRMLERAEKAGNVLPEPAPDLANIDKLVEELQSVYGGYGRKFRGILKKHLPAILESAAKMAAEKAEAEAKAAENPAPEVDTTPADVQPRRRAVPARNSDGTFAPTGSRGVPALIDFSVSA